ncbi:MAG TPA: ferric reductase-like transmembrane domain-containing protein [Reyranella sp.]|nr:ferric reductase-like transmembrane domain-containing protein [Reyranella sp.]
MSVVRVVFWLRLVTLVALCLPALDLAWRWYTDDLGARPVTAATHISGDWAVVFLLCSLALTPARSVFDWMPLVQIRRRVGVAAALYAGLHFLIYVADQKWDLVVVALEIVKRFYLTIGFATLLMLAALAITSTNGWQRRLKRNWKRLHWLVYPAAMLAILHFFIQSKANVGEATVAAGLFAWLMIWRGLPTTLRTQHRGLLLLAIGATLAALAFEVAWYGLVNNVDPLRVLRADIDPDLFPRPLHKVLLAGLAVVALAGGLRLAGSLKRLWTKRYVQETIPTTSRRSA